MIKVGLNGARNRAALSVPPGQMTELDASAVDALIWQLAGVREAMAPKREQADPGPTTLIAGGTGMRWYIERGPETGSIQLALFHQGLGWIGIVLDDPGVTALTGAIGAARSARSPSPMPP